MMAEENTKEIENDEVTLQTHEEIDHTLCGELEALEKGYAKVILHTTEAMGADSHGLVHGGFIFGAADYAAMAAVNEPNVLLSGSNTAFLAPVRVGDEVMFEAKARQTEGRRRDVIVTAFAYEVKVFEGEFHTVITENHVLNISLVNEDEA